MQNQKTNDPDGWARCWHCGHKLYKVLDAGGGKILPHTVEIKCHSCKAMNYIQDGQPVRPDYGKADPEN